MPKTNVMTREERIKRLKEVKQYRDRKQSEDWSREVAREIKESDRAAYNLARQIKHGEVDILSCIY